MNDHYRELLRQYFTFKDQHHVCQSYAIEKKLRAVVLGQDQPGQSHGAGSAGSAADSSAA